MSDIDIDIPKDNRGLTAYICFGAYGGFHIGIDAGLRITLGWVSMALVFMDVEKTIILLNGLLKYYKHEKEANHD